MKVFSSIGHFFAAFAHGIVRAGKATPAVAAVVASDASQVQAVVDPLVGALYPAAQPIERLAFQLLGDALAIVDKAEAGAQVVLPIGTDLIASLKNLGSGIKSLGAAVGVAQPTSVPVTAPAAPAA